MENILSSQEVSVKTTTDITLAGLLCVPFAPVRVLRKLGSYGRMLQLEPNVSKAPDSEFLFQLLTGHPTHQAYLRHHAGSHYKNLENHIRGKHKLSPTTKRLTANALRLSIEDLEYLAGSQPDGPLLPILLDAFQWAEGVPKLVMSLILNQEILCPCCGKNVLDDVDVWWQKNAPGIGRDEYHFAERLLRALIGKVIVESLIAPSPKLDGQHPNYLSYLANPSRHPIGNWLAEAQRVLGCNNLTDLATTMQLTGDTGNKFSKGRLKKWSSGQDVMPHAAGEAIANASDQLNSLMPMFLAARAIALISDFTAASIHASTTTTDKKVARDTVFKRINQLCLNVRLSLQSSKPTKSSDISTPSSRSQR